MPASRKNRSKPLGITRDNSDDELGIDDLPWEWIMNGESSASDQPGQIAGARMGRFICRLGDTMLLKADGLNEAWVGMICEFVESNQGEKCANFMWFSSEAEIRHQTRKRTDFLQNELYITPSWDINPLTSINGHARIVSLAEFLRRHPSGKVPRASKDSNKLFVCRRGCNTRTATYTDEFIWEDIYRNEHDIASLVNLVKTTNKTRRRARNDNAQTDLEIVQAGARHDFTSSKEGIRKATSKKNLTFAPLATRLVLPQDAALTPYQIARANLHVSAVPSALPCREKEFREVHDRLTEAIADGIGNCIYISGTPGTGKTATVREVVMRLEQAVRCEELEDFIFVEINGMKMTDPYQSYAMLWEALHGQRVSPHQALDLLEHEFNNPGPRRVPCVVLMDELDQLVTKNQGLMYNFFNWPSLPHSKLIVLAVANTMDLPERTLSNKISSRLGLTRITFPGYTHEQLVKIIQSRLGAHSGNGIVNSDAIQFASRKVAAVSGDARRALDICRRAVEMAEVLASDRAAQDEAAGRDAAKQPKVTIATIMRAINEATSNPVQQHLKVLPPLMKVVLVCIIKRTRKTGLAETTVGDVSNEVKQTLETSSDGSRGHEDHHSAELLGVLAAGSADGNKQAGVLVLRSALLNLASTGILTLESHRTERTSKLRLAVGIDEILAVLKEDPDVRGLGLSMPT